MNVPVLYRCSACQHEQLNSVEGSRCPQCNHGGTWHPKDAPTATSGSQISTAKATEQALQHFATDQFLPSDVATRSPSIELGHVAIHAPAVLKPQEIDFRSQAPFRLFVKKVPMSSEATRICLEVRLDNRSAAPLRGQLWLVDEEGLEGQPCPFSLPQPAAHATHPQTPQTLFPQNKIAQSTSGKVTIRVQPTGYAVAFWQAVVIIRHESNGTVSVILDKSVRAETALGGISNDTIHIHGNKGPEDVNWHEPDLRLRGPKELAVPADATCPDFRARHRPIISRNDLLKTPAIESARMTLSTMLADGREACVQVIAGNTLRLGRSRTWDPQEHRDHIPNDIVLRAPSSGEYDNYISRYHGKIYFDTEDVRYENFSGLGSIVDNRALKEKGDSVGLRDGSVLRPGNAAAKDKVNSFSLCIRRTRCDTNPQWYQQLAGDAHLTSGMDDVRTPGVVTLSRTDSVKDLEHYIFFPQATLIGRHLLSCGWWINHPSVQPIHATLLWFDDSFWIEPQTRNCEVKVNDVVVPLNRVRRLTPGATLNIGECRYLVLPEWKQHLIDCTCCQGHGRERAC
jgi:hypothetical protein